MAALTDLRTFPADAIGRDKPSFVADGPDALRSVNLEGLRLVYHRPSGQTHVLASPGPELIDLISGRALSVHAIAEALDLADAPEAIALIEERLAELAEAGLVRRL